jgi:polyferredoxin
MFGDFLDNVGRYPRYFISIILGIFISTFSWLEPLLKRPVTAVFVVGFLVGTIVTVALTLKAMLGLTPMT